MLILAMTVSLAGCKKTDNDGIGSLDVSQYADPEPEDDAINEPDYDDMSDEEYGDDHPFMFPEYEDYLDWHFVPSDYIGGFGSGVEPKEGGSGVVNIRALPSVDGEVVAQLRHGDDEWWVINEVYEDEDGMYIGSYQVPGGEYTWTLVGQWDEGGMSLWGWVAMEVVQFWGI